MQQRRYTAGIARGEGLVGRFGDVVVYVADASPAAAPLLSVVEKVADSDVPGATMAERLGRSGVQPDTAGAFGVVAPVADGLVVVLRGDVTAQITAVDGARELSGVGGWVEEVVAGTEITEVKVGADPGLLAASQTDLRGGVVPGGGFVLTASDAVHDQPAEPQAAAEHTMVRAPTSASPAETVMPQAAPPAQHTMIRTEAPPAPTSPAQTAVSQAVQPLPTPPGGSEAVGAVLVCEDGTTFPLDRPYVIGRDPTRAAEVRDEQADPIMLRLDRHISRVHAFVSVEGGAVFVRDNATPGGTYIAAPAASSWTQIGTAATELHLGWRILVGDQILTYRSSATA